MILALDLSYFFKMPLSRILFLLQQFTSNLSIIKYVEVPLIHSKVIKVVTNFCHLYCVASSATSSLRSSIIKIFNYLFVQIWMGKEGPLHLVPLCYNVTNIHTWKFSICYMNFVGIYVKQLALQFQIWCFHEDWLQKWSQVSKNGASLKKEPVFVLTLAELAVFVHWSFVIINKASYWIWHWLTYNKRLLIWIKTFK